MIGPLHAQALWDRLRFPGREPRMLADAFRNPSALTPEDFTPARGSFHNLARMRALLYEPGSQDHQALLDFLRRTLDVSGYRYDPQIIHNLQTAAALLLEMGGDAGLTAVRRLDSHLELPGYSTYAPRGWSGALYGATVTGSTAGGSELTRPA